MTSVSTNDLHTCAGWCRLKCCRLPQQRASSVTSMLSCMRPLPHWLASVQRSSCARRVALALVRASTIQDSGHMYWVGVCVLPSPSLLGPVA